MVGPIESVLGIELGPGESYRQYIQDGSGKRFEIIDHLGTGHVVLIGVKQRVRKNEDPKWGYMVYTSVQNGERDGDYWCGRIKTSDGREIVTLATWLDDSKAVQKIRSFSEKYLLPN